MIQRVLQSMQMLTCAGIGRTAFISMLVWCTLGICANNQDGWGWPADACRHPCSGKTLQTIQTVVCKHSQDSLTYNELFWCNLRVRQTRLKTAQVMLAGSTAVKEHIRVIEPPPSQGCLQSKYKMILEARQ